MGVDTFLTQNKCLRNRESSGKINGNTMWKKTYIYSFNQTLWGTIWITVTCASSETEHEIITYKQILKRGYFHTNLG